MRIRRIKKGFNSPNLIFFDIETITDSNGFLRFRLGVVSCLGRSFIFDDCKEFTEAIIRFAEPRRKNYIVAHNANFDFALIDQSVFSDFELSSFSTQPFLVTFTNRDIHRHITTLTFIDSMSFFKESLDSLGKTFAIEKIITDPIRDRYFTELSFYCERDTKIVERVMSFISEQSESFDIPFPVTFAQMSYLIFRRRFLKGILNAPDRPDIMTIEREAYFGGRVECFDFNAYTVAYYYDINSLYPSVMRNNFYPIAVKRYISSSICDRFQDRAKALLQKLIHQKELVIAKVEVDYDTDFIGAIPFRLNKKVVFPTGNFVTTLCSPELEMCIDSVTKVYEIVIYKKKRIFANFIDTMYQARLRYKKGEPLNMFFKLVMNSLYGKFGQRRFLFSRESNYDGILQYGNTDVRTTEGLVSISFFGGKAYRREIHLDNRKSFVAIAAFVTSYARTRLYNSLVENIDSVIYCDTDSLMLSTPATLDISDKLGDWKEEPILHNLRVLGNKHYVADGLRKLKGVPTIAEQLDDYSFKFERITKIRESVRRFGSQTPRVIEVTKTYKGDYDKRIVLENFSTCPLQVINKLEGPTSGVSVDEIQ